MMFKHTTNIISKMMEIFLKVAEIFLNSPITTNKTEILMKIDQYAVVRHIGIMHGEYQKLRMSDL